MNTQTHTHIQAQHNIILEISEIDSYLVILIYVIKLTSILKKSNMYFDSGSVQKLKQVINQFKFFTL